MGFFLVLAVGAIIYYVATKPREPKAGAWRSPRGETEASAGSLGSSVETSLDPDLDVGEFSLDPTSEDSQNSNDLGPSTSSHLEALSAGDDVNTRLLKNGSAIELIDELLRLRSIPRSKSMAIMFALVEKRSRIARRLLELELSESQRVFAINELIEDALQLDATNKTGKLGKPSARENLILIRDTYSNHESAALGAKASLGFPLIPLHDFSVSKSESDLVAAGDQFELHADKIIRHPETTARFVQLLVDLFVETNYQDHRLRTLAIRVMKRLGKSENGEIIFITKALGEQIYFSEVELGSLVERIEGGNDLARNHVQAFFEALQANPSSRIEIYRIASEVIEEYERLGHHQDAAALVNWLAKINEKNGSQEDRDEVAAKCAELFKKLQGNRAKPGQAVAPATP